MIMKRFIALASVAALAACSQAEAPEAEVEEVVEEAAPAGPVPGVYNVEPAEGDAYTIEIRDDQTFTTTSADGETSSGTFELVDGATCFSVTDSEEEPLCVVGGEPDENGVVTVTNPDGSISSTVTPVVEETSAEEAAE